MGNNNQQEFEGATMEKILEQQARTHQELKDHIRAEEGALDKIQGATDKLVTEVQRLKMAMEMIPPMDHMSDHLVMRSMAKKFEADAVRSQNRAEWWDQQRTKVKVSTWLGALGVLGYVGYYIFAEWVEYKTGIHIPRKVN